MRLPILIVVSLVLINIIVDLYLYWVIKNQVKTKFGTKIFLWSSVIATIFLVAIVLFPRRTCDDSMLYFIMWSLFSYLSIYLSKYIYVIFRIIASIPLLWRTNRTKIISKIGIVVSAACFLLIWWGALINRFTINVNEIKVEISNLPDSFNGYRIAQISDMHLGSYNGDTTFVAEIIAKINTLDIDAVMFTGDIVNRKSSEILPFINVLSKIKAKDGVFSILGNHDYGDYSDWDTQEAKQENLRQMCELQRQMKWNLLLNETVIIRREQDSIAIIGVENLGDPPFKNYGSLENADSLSEKSITKILLSHNPAHWERKIKDNKDKNIALTLSGHTHAMQMSLWGISPAAFRCKYWGGLYNDSLQQKLYVNAGVGTVTMPMRIGATPEITVITLRSK